jgi:hypothetical protein
MSHEATIINMGKPKPHENSTYINISLGFLNNRKLGQSTNLINLEDSMLMDFPKTWRGELLKINLNCKGISSNI